MLSIRTLNVAAAALGLLMAGKASAVVALSGTATISSVPDQDGVDYDYTIALKNTGGSNIGTFWFAWTPPGQPREYDFLPSEPTSADGPTGWYAEISDGDPGTSIEYYNHVGSLIAPGATGTFLFTSPDSPEDLQGTSLGFPITTSFIYADQPEVGTAAQVVVSAPEPSSLLLAGLGCAAVLRGRRRRALI